MKVVDLKRVLEHTNDDSDVMIAIKLPYTTVGAIPMVGVKYAVNGFDWESGKFIITPVENLTPADREYNILVKKLENEIGRLKLENLDLRKKLK